MPVAPAYVAIGDVDDAIAAAGKDVAALARLAEGWQGEENLDAARQAWSRVLELDSGHEGAHVGLGHHRYGITWFETYVALSAAKRAEAKRRLEAEGVVPFGDEWIPAADLPFRRMGWESLGAGEWAPPGTKERLEDETQKLAEGWQLQHRTLVSPSEFDLWRGGKWKVGTEWLDLDAANAAHAQIGAWWEVPGEHFVALTTVIEEQSRWVAWWADQTQGDLVRMFGLMPKAKPEFVCLNGIAQYNAFSAGSAAAGQRPADASGYSSVHYAYFTDGWIDNVNGAPLFRGTGAAYYDADDPALAPYGQHAVRHAAAIAWLEAVDPSWDAASQFVTSGGAFPDVLFWGEKRIPRWMRYGAASYCERFFEDKNTAEGGDPLWSRKWAIENLKKGGQLDALEDIFKLQFDTADPAKSAHLIHSAGLVMHYIMDGNDKAVGRAFAAYREALVARDDVTEPLAKLTKALGKAEKKIAKFGGL